jgi:hypothetical protein
VEEVAIAVRPIDDHTNSPIHPFHKAVGDTPNKVIENLLPPVQEGGDEL